MDNWVDGADRGAGGLNCEPLPLGSPTDERLTRTVGLVDDRLGFAMGRRSRQRLFLGVLAIPLGSCTAAPSSAVVPQVASACQSEKGIKAPNCLLPGSYGRVLLEDDGRGLRVYEHCVQGKLSPNWIVFEVPGADYEFQSLMNLLEPVRAGLPMSVEQLDVVNLEPCSWDRPKVGCLRVETKHATREARLAVARTVFDVIRDERDRSGLASNCVPVAITTSSGPILASGAGAAAPP